MTLGLPRWLRLLFSAVMLALCVVMVTQFIQQHKIEQDIAELESKIKHTQDRMPKQQREFNEYTAALPEVLAELEEVAPQAEEAKAKAAELKAQRNALREEGEVLGSLIDDLQSQLSQEPDTEANDLLLQNIYVLLSEYGLMPPI